MSRNFKETQEISFDISRSMALISTESSLNIALSARIPINDTDPHLQGVPTIQKENGQICVDTDTLRAQVKNAIRLGDFTAAPNVLNLQQAVKNILEARAKVARSRETLPNIDENTVHAVLAPTPNKRNPEFAQTVRFKPHNPNEKP
jgi:hypothetical protein